MLTEKQTLKLAHLQLQLAIINGEQWAIKQAISSPLIVINNNIGTDPEAEMRRRGIPIPTVDSQDLDEMKNDDTPGVASEDSGQNDG